MTLARWTVYACAALGLVGLTTQQDLDMDELLRQVQAQGGDINIDDLLRQAGAAAADASDDVADASSASDSGDDEAKPLHEDLLRPAPGGGGARRSPPTRKEAPSRTPSSRGRAPDPSPEPTPEPEPEPELDLDDIGTWSSDADDNSDDLLGSAGAGGYEEDEDSSPVNFGLRVDKATLSVLRRWTNFANGVLLILLGPITLAVSASQLSVDKMILSFYVCAFGILFSSQELRVEPVHSWLRHNFQFMTTHSGRATFLLL